MNIYLALSSHDGRLEGYYAPAFTYVCLHMFVYICLSIYIFVYIYCVYPVFIYMNIQGVSKKRYFSDSRLISVLEVGLYFFHVCFGIRILRQFHPAT